VERSGLLGLESDIAGIGISIPAKNYLKIEMLGEDKPEIIYSIFMVTRQF
jgi:hypothetical protein